LGFFIEPLLSSTRAKSIIGVAQGAFGDGGGELGGVGGGGGGGCGGTLAARTIGSHCGGLAPPRMRPRVFELRVGKPQES
jgi:hypothetical protein